MEENRSFRRYALTFAAVLLPFLTLGLLNVIFLFRSREIASYDSIVKEQAKRRGLYGSSLHGNDLKYKLALVKHRKPELVFIGSSRAMNFREVAFTKSFTNCGGVFTNLAEGETFVNEMLKFHRPELAVLLVDYWWFHPDYDQETNRYNNSDETTITFERITYPIKWVLSGKVPLALYTSVITKGSYQNQYTAFDNLGVFALTYSGGFRFDGSYFNSKATYAITNMYESLLGQELKSIEAGTFERVNKGYGKFAKAELIERYRRMVEQLQKSGTKVVILLPPVMPLFLNAIVKAKPEPFVSDLARQMRTFAPEVYDFTAYPEAKGPNCEYIDGFHLGDVLSLRVLKEMTRINPSSALRPYLNEERMNKLMTEFAGRTLLPIEPNMYTASEKDFLSLGCNRGTR